MCMRVGGDLRALARCPVTPRTPRTSRPSWDAAPAAPANAQTGDRDRTRAGLFWHDVAIAGILQALVAASAGVA